MDSSAGGKGTTVTEDQVRLRLAAVLRRGDTPFDSFRKLLDLLEEVLPPLLKAESERAVVMDDQRLTEIAIEHQSVPHKQDWHCRRCGVPWPCSATTLVEELRRLKRENHLLSLSRGIPSGVGAD